MQEQIQIEIGADLTAVKRDDGSFEVFDVDMEWQFITKADACIIEAIAKSGSADALFSSLKEYWIKSGRIDGRVETQFAIRRALGL